MLRKACVLFGKPTALQVDAKQDAADSRLRGWDENAHFTARRAAR